MAQLEIERMRCPKCQAELRVDRPTEARSAPCPQCQFMLHIPRDLVSRNPSFVQAGPSPTDWSKKITARSNTDQRTLVSSVVQRAKLLIWFVVMLSVGCSAGLFAAYTSLIPHEPDERERQLSQLPYFISKSSELESRLQELTGQITAIENENLQYQKQIEAVLGKEFDDIESIVVALASEAE